MYGGLGKPFTRSEFYIFYYIFILKKKLKKNLKMTGFPELKCVHAYSSNSSKALAFIFKKI